MGTKPKQLSEHEQRLGAILAGAAEATVYVIYRHRSRSGMQRVVDPMVVYHGTMLNLRGLAEAAGYRLHPTHDGVIVNGCGFDAGYDVADAMCRLVGLDVRGFHVRSL